jgi:hypothetical protein
MNSSPCETESPAPEQLGVHDGLSLTDIYDATAQRDEAIEKARTEFIPAELELNRLASEGDPENRRSDHGARCADGARGA